MNTSMIDTRYTHKLIGRRLSKKTRKKISNSLTGHKQSAETIAKRIATIAPKNRGKKRTHVQREKISIGTRKNMKKQSIRKKISDAQRKRFSRLEEREATSRATKMGMTLDVCNKIRIARQRQIIPCKDTSIEIILQKELDNEKIKYTTHANILGQPDIFIKPNICIFADGDYWHNLEYRKKRDKEVNEKLHANGYVVIRLWEHDIINNIKYCLNQIKQII